MTKTVKTFVEVQADDIRKIGGTICEGDNGFTHFLCDTATANIEEILLRSILKCFGDDWKSPVCVTPEAQVPLTLESKFRMTPIKS